MLASVFFSRGRSVLFTLRFLLQSRCDSSLPEGAIQIAIGGRIWNSTLRRKVKRREEQCHLPQMASHLPYRPLTVSADSISIQSFHSSLFTATYSLAAVANATAASPLPYRYLKHRLFPIYQKHSCHFAVRRNFTPKAHHFPLAANITRRRRISLFNRRGG